MRKVKITDVAAAAGVSRATADRVLNRRGSVSMDKERAVLLSARELGLDRNLEMPPLKTLRVCVLMKPPHNPFYEQLGRGFREANLLFAGRAIAAYVNHIDVLAPESIRRRLHRVAADYDALVLVAPAYAGLIEALRVIAARIPVVTLATDLPLDMPHYYVGPSNRRAGRLAGELMGRLLGGRGDVLLVAGLREFSGHEERRIGFRDVLAEDYRCRVIAEIDSLDQGAMIADAVVDALRQHPSIRGIYNISQGNDEIAGRIRRCGLGGNVTFICHDLTDTTRALLLSRSIDVVIDQDPVLEARRAMEIVLGHYGRPDRNAPAICTTPLRVFFRENVPDEMP